MARSTHLGDATADSESKQPCWIRRAGHSQAPDVLRRPPATPDLEDDRTAGPGAKRVHEVVSLRRHCPDQVLEVADLSASQPFGSLSHLVDHFQKITYRT